MVRPGVLELTPQSITPSAIEDLDHFLDVEHGRGPATLVGPDGRRQILPDGIYDLLAGIVEQLKAGNGVTVMPLAAELTTAEAAQILNVSRPFLIKQLEMGAIAYRLVGTHRRLRLQDVLEYRSATDAKRREALERLHRSDEESGLPD